MLPTNYVINTSSQDDTRKARVAYSLEKARRRVVKYVFWVYWLLIFEGALRKWVFPQFHEIIFFARDPIVLLIYFVAWRNGLVKRDMLLTTGALVSAVFIPLMLIQVLSTDMNPLTLIYGWRMYFMYLPLMFVIKDTFNPEDIDRLIRQTLYICIPISVLVYVQYISDPSSVINQGYSEGKVFIVADNIVRTTGTFTFTAGQTMFSASLISMTLIAWLNRKISRMPVLPLLAVASLSSIITLLLTGSRTAFFLTGLIILAAFLGLQLTKRVKQKVLGTIFLVCLVIVGAALFMGPFKKSYDALETRFEQAEVQEGTANRALSPLVDFTDNFFRAPLMGVGLGYGTSGGVKLATGKQGIVLPENEWSRVIMEVGPVFGAVYIIYRVIFTLSVFSGCMKTARVDGNLVPMIFLGFIGFYMFAGNVTQTGTVHGYNWIFMGLTMASIRNRALKK